MEKLGRTTERLTLRSKLTVGLVWLVLIISLNYFGMIYKTWQHWSALKIHHQTLTKQIQTMKQQRNYDQKYIKNFQKGSTGQQHYPLDNLSTINLVTNLITQSGMRLLNLQPIANQLQARVCTTYTQFLQFLLNLWQSPDYLLLKTDNFKLTKSTTTCNLIGQITIQIYVIN